MGDAAERLAHTLKALEDAGLEAVGQVVHPDPYTAIQNALQFYAPDDIVISTFPETRSGWLRNDLIGRVQTSTGKPVEHVVSEDERLMESASVAAGHAVAHDDHHGPPAANVSSRVEAQFLGMLLFIISEIMLFGAFFTAYFFIRVVGDDRVVPGRRQGAPEGRSRASTPPSWSRRASRCTGRSRARAASNRAR